MPLRSGVSAVVERVAALRDQASGQGALPPGPPGISGGQGTRGVRGGEGRGGSAMAVIAAAKSGGSRRRILRRCRRAGLGRWAAVAVAAEVTERWVARALLRANRDSGCGRGGEVDGVGPAVVRLVAQAGLGAGVVRCGGAGPADRKTVLGGERGVATGVRRLEGARAPRLCGDGTLRDVVGASGVGRGNGGDHSGRVSPRLISATCISASRSAIWGRVRRRVR